jgi:hypothetical protein
MAQIFISYSKSDHQAAKAIVGAIRQAGLNAFDESDLPQGVALGDNIAGAIDTAQCVVILWSKAASGSKWVQLEIQRALKAWASDRLVLATLDEAPLPIGLRDLAPIHIDGDGAGIQELIERVKQNVRASPNEVHACVHSAGVPDAMVPSATKGSPRLGIVLTLFACVICGAAALYVLNDSASPVRAPSSASPSEPIILPRPSVTQAGAEWDRQAAEAKAAAEKARQAAEAEVKTAAEKARQAAEAKAAAEKARLVAEAEVKTAAEKARQAAKTANAGWRAADAKAAAEKARQVAEAKAADAAMARQAAEAKAADAERARQAAEAKAADAERARQAAEAKAAAENARQAAEAEVKIAAEMARRAAEAKAAAEKARQNADVSRTVLALVVGALIGAGVIGAVWVILRRRQQRAKMTLLMSVPEARSSQSEVFVSYSQKDEIAVDALVKQIQELGHAIWIDRQSTGSQRYAGKIVEAIKKSRFVALMCSQNAFASDHVVREVYIAGDLKKPFIVFLLEPAELPNEILYFVSGFPRLAVTSMDVQKLRLEIARVVTTE